ncbi:MAG: hypothetical protein ACOWWR_05665 [Eubacteriales bacterium]
MKRIVIFIIIACVILLSSCTTGSYTTFKSVESNKSDLFSMKYEKFNGYKSRAVSFKEDTEIIVDIVSSSGELDITIKNEDDHIFYEGHDVPTSEFTVAVDGEGKYTITVEGHDHKGSFKISW